MTVKLKSEAFTKTIFRSIPIEHSQNGLCEALAVSALVI
jgi:hypothetical protein